jgi:hypothetical protein
MNKFNAFLVSILVLLSFNTRAQQQSESDYELVGSIEFATGPQDVKDFQYFCGDEIGYYAVYFDYAKKQVFAFTLRKLGQDNLIQNSNQTVSSKFNVKKNKITFTTADVLDVDSKLDMVLSTSKTSPNLKIHSHSSGKDYVLACLTYEEFEAAGN